MKPRPAISAVITAVALSLLLGACGGSDDTSDDARTSPPASQTPFGGATPPGSLDQLPPEFLKCMKDQGYEVESPDEIHSAPPQVLQACFGALHQGGAGGGTP